MLRTMSVPIDKPMQFTPKNSVTTFSLLDFKNNKSWNFEMHSEVIELIKKHALPWWSDNKFAASMQQISNAVRLF